MKRRQFLAGTTAVAVAASSPSLLGNPLTRSDTLTELTLHSDLDVALYGDGQPSFIVEYDGEADLESLEAWIEDETDGRILYEYDNFDAVSCTVSWEDAGVDSIAGFDRVTGGMQSLDYVELVDANALMSYPEPISNLQDASAVEYDLSTLEGFWLSLRQLRSSSSSDVSGLAFDDDAPDASLGDARELVNAGDDVVDSVDTSDVTVAIIDTGANDRSVLRDGDGERRILDASTDFTSAGNPTGHRAVSDDNGHGDWVATCIAAGESADDQGFLPGADILVARALDDDGQGSTDDIIAGVDLAIEHDADVACLSLGSPLYSKTLANALEEAYDNGVFPVVAVGNDRYASVFVASPASAEHGFGVSATNVPESGDREDTRIAYFANVGPQPGTIDGSSGASQEGGQPLLAAPGMNVEVDGAGRLSGTSMAAPMVAGAAGLLCAAGHDVEETWDRLLESAYPLPEAGTTEAGSGLLDVGAALDGAEHEETQSEARGEEATARDVFNERLSKVQGRRLGGLL